MSTVRKYVLCPDYITSATDGEVHFVSAIQLAQLYAVPICECNIWERGKKKLFETDENTIYLYPRYHGDYIEWLQEQQGRKHES